MNTASDNPPTAQPQQAATLAGKVMALVGVVISCVYLANLTAGLFPEIPDNFPVVGNLDEVFFTALLLGSLAKLGIPLLPNLASRPPAPPGIGPR